MHSYELINPGTPHEIRRRHWLGSWRSVSTSGTLAKCSSHGPTNKENCMFSAAPVKAQA